jgi:hypothetical protein
MNLKTQNKNYKMATLTIDEAKAREIYPTASCELKTILEDTFSKQFFSQKITDRVKSFEDACKVTGGDPESRGFTVGSTDEIAYKKLKTIISALNEDWKPDWNNSNEPKYYPWFYQNAPGFRLHDVICGYTASCVGSRLCFKSRELAEYAVKQFFSLYKDFFTA